MSDLLTDARETFADISSRRPGQTHYDGCRTEHVGCLLAELVAEVERLREAIRRIADQDATLSVCDGNVTVQMDATLTDEPLAYCCRLLADSQGIIEAKNAEIELLRGYRDEAESQAAIASLAADRLRLTDAEREAVETSFDAMQYAADELGLSQADCDRLVATLRGLLERQPSTPQEHTTPTGCTVRTERTSLTDAEREAISLMAEVAADPRGGAVLDGYEVAATLRGLLERHSTT